MDHVAIMKKSWGLIPKILNGRKKIESRWGKNKSAPWGKVKPGDIVYFKNAGELVTVKAKVSKILEFENFNPQKVREILEEYGGDDGISITNLKNTILWAKDKRYCTLIYLTKAKNVKPFNIDRTGFGSRAAWICVDNINKIKITDLI